MCTVSYVPAAGGYILTSNRDEDPARSTRPPEFLELRNGLKVIAPRDEVKGGTWLAAGTDGRMACLMNGAFGKHQRQLPYRKSRGFMVFEAMEARTFETFIEEISPERIEPFTLLMCDREWFWKLVWDGARKYAWEIPSESIHLWSSPTLYSPQAHAAKEHYFKTVLSAFDPLPEAIYHLHGGKGATPFVLDKPGVRTVSITQVEYCNGSMQLRYYLKPASHEDAVLVSSLTA